MDRKVLKTLFRVPLLVLAVWFYSLEINAQQPAFPGAEGFGRFTTGGRGGAVYEVYNLNDAGPGSFRDACLKSGARTIVFRVSGTIYLKSKLSIKNGDLTIAGQTAPGDGICIAGYNVFIDASNVIVRYMRFRLGNLNVSDCECDAFGGEKRSDIIIDHCSASWSIDEACSFYDNTNFTMQWCIVSESLYDAGHVKGNHGYGGIQGGRNASFHHNLYASHTSRNPRFCGGRYNDPADNRENVDFRNNVIFNWGFNSVYGGELGRQNMINNYFKPGPATKSGVKNRIVEINRGSEADPGQWYIAGNYVSGSPVVTADNWNGGVQGTDAGSPGVRVPVPFEYAPVSTLSAEEAYQLVLDNAGAILPKRDPVDTRILSEVRSGNCTYGDTYNPQTGIALSRTGIINSQASVGGWPELTSVTAPVDSDRDGMPDTWENENRLNPNDPTDRNRTGSGGYTMLETYLNGIGNPATNLIVTENPDFRIYPLPAGNFLNIEFPRDWSGEFSIYLYAENGLLWYSEKDTVPPGRLKKFPVTTLFPGFYLCVIRNGNKTVAIKICKQ